MNLIQFARLSFAAAMLSLGCSNEIAEGGAVEEVGVASSALTNTMNRSLVITGTSVTREATRTEDPCSTTAGDEDKVWSIGHMLKREAEKQGLDPQTYATNWINSWNSTTQINGQDVPPLLGLEVRDAWRRFGGGGTALPLHDAPFYLLAIVNRIDLRKHRPLGEPLGGEVRFVFGILGATQNNPPCPTTEYHGFSTMIVEYSPAKSDENAVRDFAKAWLDLSDKTGPTFRTNLQTLTEDVINNGRLLRIRTNEGSGGDKIGGDPTGWDLGEFEPNPTTKYLQRSTIKQSPTMALAGNTSSLVSDWIWANRESLYANAFDYEVALVGSKTATSLPIGSYSVPNKFPGTNTWFRGSLNTVNASPFGEFWGGPWPYGVPSIQEIQWEDARFRFSVGTCRGCHGGETHTRFMHVVPSVPGSEATRSEFLLGSVTVTDPANPDRTRSFDEMQRRENDLRALADGAPVLVPVFGNYYTVSFLGSSKCLDSAGDTTTDGAFSQLYQCHGKRNQRLALISAGSGVYNLKYKHSGKCIDVQNASTASGARVIQATCNSARASQKLTLSVLSGQPLGTVAPRVLRFQHSNLCLLVQNQGTSDGTAIVQGTCPVAGEFSKAFHLVE